VRPLVLVEIGREHRGCGGGGNNALVTTIVDKEEGKDTQIRWFVGV